MMVGLYDSNEDKEKTKEKPKQAPPPEPQFDKIQKFSVVFSLPSTPNDVKMVEKNCTTEKEV